MGQVKKKGGSVKHWACVGFFSLLQIFEFPVICSKTYFSWKLEHRLLENAEKSWEEYLRRPTIKLNILHIQKLEFQRNGYRRLSVLFGIF